MSDFIVLGKATSKFYLQSIVCNHSLNLAIYLCCSISNGCTLPVIWMVGKIITGTYSAKSDPYTSAGILKSIYDYVLNHFPKSKLS